MTAQVDDAATTWRGKADADDAERTSAEATDADSVKQLRGRSQALLRDLLRPHKRRIIWIVVLLLIMNAANLAGPYLVMEGIDKGIPPLSESGDYSVLLQVAIAFAVVTVAEYVATRNEIALSSKVSQAMLLDLRRRVFAHFNRLSVSFHERFTSGRVVARMTSDMDAIRELSDNGVHDLVLAGLSVVSIAGIMLVTDFELALVALVTFPIMEFWATGSVSTPPLFTAVPGKPSRWSSSTSSNRSAACGRCSPTAVSRATKRSSTG